MIHKGVELLAKGKVREGWRQMIQGPVELHLEGEVGDGDGQIVNWLVESCSQDEVGDGVGAEGEDGERLREPVGECDVLGGGRNARDTHDHALDLQGGIPRIF